MYVFTPQRYQGEEAAQDSGLSGCELRSAMILVYLKF